jgi:aerobic-type carbon monoxide dehydrogenase small subunit (CoxS/CutS family)
LKLLLPALAMLAVMSVAASAPAVHAVTTFKLSVTVAIPGQTPQTFTVPIVSANGNNVFTIAVGSALLSQIQSAFKHTTFAFPGSYTGTFIASGFTFTVTLESQDTFTLIFTQAPA